MRKGAPITLTMASILIISIFFSMGSANGRETAPFTRAGIPHDPVDIQGNTELVATAASEGWTGTGTPEDPIVISDLKIIVNGPIGIELSETDLHVLIRDNNISSANDAGILIDSSSNVTVSENLMFSFSSADAIRLEDSSLCVLERNTLDMEEQIVIGYNGIRLVDSPGIVIEGNRVCRMTNNGITITGTSTGTMISGNHLEECGNVGIYSASDSNIITDNTAFGNGWGVKTTGSSNEIRENSFWRNGYGVQVYGGSDNLVADNILTRNFKGVDVITSLRNEIHGNYIAKSESFGVDLYCNSGSGNAVHSNHFYYNNGSLGSFKEENAQARDLSMGNYWYNTTSGRGNYWFDWTGVDGDSDGIVDLSYPVSGAGDRDWKPLKNPTIPDVFDPPWRVAAHPQSTYIDITWEAPYYSPEIKVQSYLIYRSERGGGELYLDSVPSASLTYRDEDVKGGRAYFYYIVANNDIALSNASSRIKSSPDTMRPSISITGPEEGEYFNRDSVEILYTGSDNIALDRFEISLDGKSPFDNTLLFNHTFLDLDEGLHTVDVTVYDLAEHNRTDSVSFFVDTIDPGVSLDTDGTGPMLTRDTSPTLTWSGSDDGSGVKGYSVSVDGQSDTWLGDYREYTLNDLSPGEHTFRVTVKDRAGNTDNDTLNLTVDPDDPYLDIIHPTDMYINNTGSIDMRLYARDDISNISGFLVRYGTLDWIDIGLERTYALRDMEEGSHTIYVRVFDNAGNNITANRLVIVDMTPPEVELVHPVEGEVYNSAFNLQFTASDLLTGISGTTLIMDDGDPVDFGPNDPINLDFEEDGFHSMELIVHDGAGNNVSVKRNFSFDVTRPRIISFQPSGTGVNITSSVEVRFSERMDTESILVDMEGIEGTFRWNEENLTFDPLEDLEYDTKYSLSISGTDIAGNTLVPFDWFFETEYDLREGAGIISGRIVDGTGTPLSNATIRVETGEIGYSNATGWFSIKVTEGSNHLIVSYPGYADSRIGFEVAASRTYNMGDIPVKPEVVEDDENDEGGIPLVLIVLIIVVIVGVFGVLVGWQIKRTKESSGMDLPDISAGSGNPPSENRVTREFNTDGHTVVDHFDG